MTGTYLYLKDSWKCGTSETSSSKQPDRFTFQIVWSQMHFKLFQRGKVLISSYHVTYCIPLILKL